MCLSFASFGREIKSLNDGWLFAQHNDTVPVHLPHCWNSDAYSTVDYFRGEGSYIRNLSIPEAAQGKKVFLQMDGAASKSKVFIDGKEAGAHVGAYSTYLLDVTPYFADGLSHDLKIVVDNSDPAIPPYSADFTFMGGLYRDVALVVVDALHLDSTAGPLEGFKTKAVRKDDGTWLLTVSGTLKNESKARAKAKLVAVLSDSDGNEVLRTAKNLTLTPEADSDFILKLDNISNPRLWSPESPQLYTVRVNVEADGKIADSGQSTVGFRTFGFDNQGRFLLNGEPYKLRGMCRHQDQAPMGIALTDEMHRRDMRMIKDMGANFIRISHYPQDDAVLEMCDRLGLIAWEEVPVIDYVPLTDGFDDNAEIMLRDMIRRHYNHPSVAMWGYMNEILLRVPWEERDSAYSRTLSLAKRLQEVVKEEDPDRLTTMAYHGSDAYHEAGLSDLTDVQGWNLYQGWYGGRMDEFEESLSRQHRQHPHHHLIVSEYGAGSDRRIHSLEPEPFDFSIEYQQDYLEHYLPVIEDSAFVAGASHWNFIDFSSAKRAESMPHINNKGLLTNNRVPKDVYYYYSAVWHDVATDTVAHIAVDDWTNRRELPDARGRVVRPVKVYTNLPAVELHVNGKSYGTLTTENCTAEFKIDLTDGKNILELYSGEGKLLDSEVIDALIYDVEDGRLNLGTDEFAVNVGSNCYFRSDDSGLIWLPDAQYSENAVYGCIGGKRVVTQDEIALTSDQPLLQRAVNGLQEYRIAVVPGTYEVEMLFAEQGKPSAASAYMLGHNAGTGSEWSSMDIFINGRQVEQNFAPGEVSKPKTMVRRRYQTNVGDDGLVVRFDGVSTLSGIKVRKL